MTEGCYHGNPTAEVEPTIGVLRKIGADLGARCLRGEEAGAEIGRAEVIPSGTASVRSGAVFGACGA